jgi:hypothetical protein
VNLPDRVLGPRRIAVLPVHDEDATIADTLDKLTQVVDEVVVVDHGSADATRQEARAWFARRGHDTEPGRLLCADRGMGRPAAYALAFADLARRLDEGTLSPDDLVLTLDHGVRHPLDLLDDLHRLAVREWLDALLVRRDRSGVTPQRRVAGALVSAWASLWAGARLHDVETGYRIFRLAPLADTLDQSRSARSARSGHVELAVTMARLGCRVRNDVLVAVPSRPASIGPSAAVADLLAVPAAAFRAETSRAETARTAFPDPSPSPAPSRSPHTETATVAAVAAVTAPLSPIGAVDLADRGPRPGASDMPDTTERDDADMAGSGASTVGHEGGIARGRDQGTGGVWTSPMARALARLVAPLTATAALLGAALWIVWRAIQSLRRLPRPGPRSG